MPQPKSGVFREWSGNVTGAANPVELTMNANKAVFIGDF